MQAQQQYPSNIDDVLAGLPVYSRDFVPLGRIAQVVDTASAAVATLAGRRIAIAPSEGIQSQLAGEDLIVSEAMIFEASPEQDRVILNVSARRVVDTARQLHRSGGHDAA